ncbi:MAG: hypothetical protein M3322_07990 [Actinomycetota bacterium]|nr:hypothetical protein [Actinomycetota bacterium]
MIAYKFLSAGAVGLYSGFRWPVPSNGEPGPWVHVDGPLVAGVSGVHALSGRELVNWLDDELWLIELAGQIDEQEGLLIARRGRLVRLVDAWGSETAAAFTQDCVFRTRECAIEALLRAGRADDADTVRGVNDLDALQDHVAALSTTAAGFAADALAYVADAIELSRGGRPDRYRAHPGVLFPASPGPIAANLGFAAAHAAASSVADATGDPGQYEAGFQREREHQRAWLMQHLGLPESGLEDLVERV